jgi:hypothetical protein
VSRGIARLLDIYNLLLLFATRIIVEQTPDTYHNQPTTKSAFNDNNNDNNNDDDDDNDDDDNDNAIRRLIGSMAGA